ncbi:MAG: hypothetical protein K8F60_12785 [Melioribacteraceae bacterium]|jgi:hypothetical protein|nr:hypothetical protein [Ignavibacteriota bacterium]MBZ0183325.1 hypothetical protein [Melioribacteraceae bacterium]
MKVYESSNSTNWNNSKIPQIKIKNKKLISCGFEIGKEYKVIYQHNKIILIIIANEKSKS